MKKTVIFVVMLPFMLCLCTCGRLPEPPKIDYIKMLSDAAYSGDYELGEQIEALMAQYDKERMIDFSALCLLSRFMRYAYGGGGDSDKLRLYAGEVVLNRTENAIYPDTVEEVISQMGYDVNEILKTQPRKTDIKNAVSLLQGERGMKSSVVNISDTPPDKPYAVFCDSLRGNVYFSEDA